MNYEHCQLDELEVEHFQVKEVLRCLLHTILYQRILGATPSNRHREEESTLFEISYLRFDDEGVRATVEERIEQFAKSLDRANEVRGQVDLSFFERRLRKGLLGLHNVEERVCWERWSVPLTVRSRPYQHHSERAEAQATLETQLTERLCVILHMCAEKKEHLPPIESLARDAIAFEISTTNSAESWGVDLFKRMLQATPPMPAVN
jgi:autophagy-related protein 101